VIKFRITGLDTKEGEVRMQDLHRVLGALLKTAERATRLLASGSGSARAKTPAWLRQSTDFVVTGLSRGSTIIEIKRFIPTRVGKARIVRGLIFVLAVHPHACGEGSRIVKHLGDLKANLCLKRKGAL